MFLTRQDEAMLNGEYGEGPEIAMSVLVKLGEMYGADKMLKIENVHIDGAAYGGINDSGACADVGLIGLIERSRLRTLRFLGRVFHRC